jgi:hypothetical protein
MSKIIIERQHALGTQGVRTILDRLAKDPMSSMISWRWDETNSQHLLCEGKQGMTKGCTGDLSFTESTLKLTLNLPGGLSLFKALVEKEVNKQLDKYLA